MRTIFAVIAVVISLAPVTGGAQGGGGRRGQGGMPPEQRIGELAGEVMQLTDQQRPKFADVTRRFGDRQKALNDEERTARGSMRNLLCNGDTTRSTEMARSLDLLLDLQKRRHQLAEEEQREMATFLTPYQRARFLGIRERMADLVGGRGGGGGRGGRMGGPPPDGGGPPPGGPPDGVRGQGRGRGGPPPDICAAPPGGPPQGRGGR